MSEAATGTVINDDDVYWNMEWGKYTPVHKDKPAVERMFEEEPALARLLAEGVLCINSFWWEKEWPKAAQESIAIAVNCNDIFAWGCADAEPLKHEDLQNLYDHWLKDRIYGPAVWCCKKRKELPQAPVRKAIEKAGIWDLSAMELDENFYDAAMKKRAAERAAG